MSDEQNDKPTPMDQNAQADPLGGDRMLAGMIEYITGKVPTKLVAPAQREPFCMEFIEMLGRIVEFMERFHPLSPAKMAAVAYFFEQVDFRHMDEDQAYLVLTLVDGAKNTARKMRREARPA